MRYNRLGVLSMILAGVLLVGAAYWLAGAAYGVTRFYFPALDTYASPLPATTFYGPWNSAAALTTGAVTSRGRLKRSWHKSVSAAGGTCTTARVTCTNVANTYIILRQFISDPLAAQTITGNVHGQVICLATTALRNTLALFIQIITATGSSRATLLGVSAYTGTTGSCTIPTGAAAARRNRRFMDSVSNTLLNLSSTTCENGDRLVIEIGYRQTTATAGRSVWMYFGDSGNVDVASGDTTTTTTTGTCPWIEFSHDFTFPVLVPVQDSD